MWKWAPVFLLAMVPAIAADLPIPKKGMVSIVITMKREHRPAPKYVAPPKADHPGGLL